VCVSLEVYSHTHTHTPTVSITKKKLTRIAVLLALIMNFVILLNRTEKKNRRTCQVHSQINEILSGERTRQNNTSCKNSFSSKSDNLALVFSSIYSFPLISICCILSLLIAISKYRFSFIWKRKESIIISYIQL